MNEIVMFIIGCGALIGGIDKILGNRFGLGSKFDDGFQYMGSMALSMTGIICLAPVLSSLLSNIVVPLYHLTGIDPAMFGSILAIDMGGYQLAMDLAVSEEVGRFAGIIASAMFGCTLVFTIPVGMSVLKKEERPLFLKGILAGLISLPVGLTVGGLLQGLPILTCLFQCIPLFLISLLLLIGLIRFPEKTVFMFARFADFIQLLATVGLACAAFEYITGITLIPGMAPLADAMATVASIAIVMLGSLPIAELLRRALSKPFAMIGKKTGLNDASTTGIIVGTITVMPALVMIKDMDQRGKVLCGAFLVCGAAVIGAHMGFAAGTEPQLITPLLLSKFAGAFVACCIAMFMTRKKEI